MTSRYNGASSTTRGQTTCAIAILVLLSDKRSNAYFAEGISRGFLSFYVSTGRRFRIFFATRSTTQEGRCISFLDYSAPLSFLCVHFSCSNYTNVTYLF